MDLGHMAGMRIRATPAHPRVVMFTTTQVPVKGLDGRADLYVPSQTIPSTTFLDNCTW